MHTVTVQGFTHDPSREDLRNDFQRRAILLELKEVDVALRVDREQLMSLPWGVRIWWPTTSRRSPMADERSSDD